MSGHGVVRALRAALQAPLDEQHQCRMRGGERKQSIGDIRDEKMEPEHQVGRIGQHLNAAEHERQQARDERDRQRKHAQAIEWEEQAFNPVAQHTEPEHCGQREREAVDHRAFRKDGQLEQQPMHDQRDPEQ